MDRQPVVICNQLFKSYGSTPVVRNLNLAILPGTCYGLLGPNGAGKTTTLRMLLGLSPPTSGTLKVFGKDIAVQPREIRARTGVVPQADNLDPDFTVAENLRVYAQYFRLGGSEIEQRIDRLLTMVELQDQRQMRIPKLSGGMQRRLTIARALINEPKLLVLDEPTTGLDPQARHMIWALVHRLKRSGKTILLTTHYMEEAERLCDNIGIIDNGRLLTEGDPRSLILEHSEAQVVEIRGDLDPSAISSLNKTDYRVERMEDTLYIYADDANKLSTVMESFQAMEPLHRPANLEDVFLRLTGRDLR
jgi:lipooligosaccharide transport system ATP-binding protein